MKKTWTMTYTAKVPDPKSPTKFVYKTLLIINGRQIV